MSAERTSHCVTVCYNNLVRMNMHIQGNLRDQHERAHYEKQGKKKQYEEANSCSSDAAYDNGQLQCGFFCSEEVPGEEAVKTTEAAPAGSAPTGTSLRAAPNRLPASISAR